MKFSEFQPINEAPDISSPAKPVPKTAIKPQPNPKSPTPGGGGSGKIARAPVTPDQPDVKNLSGNIVPGGVMQGVKYATGGGKNYVDTRRSSNPEIKGTKDPHNMYTTSEPDLYSIAGKKERIKITDPEKIKNARHDDQQRFMMQRSAAEKKNKELVKRGLNSVPVAVDQHGVGLEFASQASVDARNRQKRRQAFKDDNPRYDFSQYSPEEMAQIKSDAAMDTKTFGNAILDQIEKRTRQVNKLDRSHVNNGRGGIGWTDPRYAYDEIIGDKNTAKRIEKYRDADPYKQAQLRKFDPNLINFNRVDPFGDN
jgi:hypothetical protein